MKKQTVKKLVGVILGVTTIFSMAFGGVFGELYVNDVNADEYDEENWDYNDDWDDDDFDENGLRIENGKLTDISTDSESTIVLPDTVKAIAGYAVGSNVKELTISKNVSKIEKSAFISASQLNTIKVDKDNKFYTVKNKCLYDKKGKTLLFVPRNATSVKFYSKAVTIESYAFAYCDKLKKVTVPKKMKTINTNAFYYCKKLKSVVIKGKNTKLKANALYGNKVKRLKNLTSGKMPSKKGYLVITCAKGSKAQKFAKKNSILWKEG